MFSKIFFISYIFLLFFETQYTFSDDRFTSRFIATHFAFFWKFLFFRCYDF